jgi:hypothetical protein
MAKTQVPTSPREPAVAPVGVAKEQYSLGAALRAYFLRVRGGDLGAMPAVLGFVVLFVLFSITAKDANFLSTRNFANLLTQAAPITLIGVGLVFVLLLGEIDLSAGATAGVCAVSMAWLLDNDYSPWIALPAGIVIGIAIGALTGWLVAKVGIPSFVAAFRRAGARKRPLRLRKDQRAHSGIPGGAPPGEESQGLDPLLRGTSGRGQNLAWYVDRQGHRPQVRTHVARRRAR